MPTDFCFISPGLYRYLKTEEGKAAGGAERQQHMLANELKRRGYNISMIVGNYGQPAYEIINGINVWNGCPQGVDSISSITREALKLFQTMRRVDADIYYVRGAPRLASLVSVFVHFLNKDLIFCIANESDLDPDYLHERYNRVFYSLYRRAISDADQVVTQTKTQQSMLRKNFGEGSIVIPNGYNLPRSSEIEDHGSREFVLWVGRSNEKKKKPMRYLNLARKLPEIPFVMVAQPSNDGSHHRVVQNECKSIVNLEFVDTVAPDKIHQYYNKATVLVNTSDYEGFPNTYLEAWRYRTPVVSLYHELDNVFSTEEIGIRSGSMEKLTDDVEQIHQSKETRQGMGNRGREYVKNNYLLQDIVDKYEMILKELQ